MPRNVLVLGVTGAGKSTLCHLLSGDAAACAPASGGALSQTKQLQRYPVDVDGHEYTLVDTVGLMDTCMTREKMMDELNKTLEAIKAEGFVQVFYVLRGRFTAEAKEAFHIVHDVLLKSSARKGGEKFVTLVRTDFQNWDNPEACARDEADLRGIEPATLETAARVVHVDMVPVRYAQGLPQDQDPRHQARLRLKLRLTGCTQVHSIGAECTAEVQRWKRQFEDKRRREEEESALKARRAQLEEELGRQYATAATLSGSYGGKSLTLELGTLPGADCVVDFAIPAGIDARLDEAFGSRGDWYPNGGVAFLRNMRYIVILE